MASVLFLCFNLDMLCGWRDPSLNCVKCRIGSFEELA
uniref:Uncharacterized protein n=1 Tax=Rhizophora mucronata TaxID=61149 RepID=A0A2P2J2W9_RHIMU